MESFSFNYRLEKDFDTFELRLVNGLFEILKMFYPPKGLCKAEPEWGPFDSFHFIVSREGCSTL